MRLPHGHVPRGLQIVGQLPELLMGLDWGTALLPGAIVGSTDAAAVSALRTRSGVTLNERVAATRAVESGVNDPVAVYLTLAFIALLAAPAARPAWHCRLLSTSAYAPYPDQPLLHGSNLGSLLMTFITHRATRRGSTGSMRTSEHPCRAPPGLQTCPGGSFVATVSSLAMIPMRRVPVFAAGRRRAVVLRTPEVRGRTTGTCSSAVGRRSPVGGT